MTMESLAEKALQAVEKGELTIMPERFEKACNLIYLIPFVFAHQLFIEP